MGGVGSGRRPGSGRVVAEVCFALDVNRLHREGCLRLGWTGAWQWTRDGKTVASTNMRADADLLYLSYAGRDGESGLMEVTQRIGIVRDDCTYGGARPYFLCPGGAAQRGCGRRVAKIFWRGDYFRCRHCHGLAYASQRETPLDRTVRRASKVRRRLGGEAGLAMPFPERPKGMWRRTYVGMRDAVLSAEFAANDALERNVERVLARLDEPRGRRSFWL